MSKKRRKVRASEAAIRLIGLGARAGTVVTGTERVRLAARSDDVAFAIIAADASDNAKDKVLPLLRAKGVPHTVLYDRAELGAAVGRAPISALGLTDPPLASRVQTLIASENEAG